ncbi:MAG: SurA N-terminal domain-containing protein [Candidatus Auribacterota bacterium]
MKNVWKVRLWVLIGISAILCANSLPAQEGGEEAGQALPDTITFSPAEAPAEAEQRDPNAVVATVNKVPILQVDLDRASQAMLNMLRQSPYFQGMQNIPMKYIRQQALETLVTSELMYQKGKELGITVSAEEVDEEILAIKGVMSEDEFQGRLNAQGNTIESLRGSITKTIMVRKAAIAIMPKEEAEISDEEVQEFYNQMQSKLERVDDMLKCSHILMAVYDNDTPEQIAEKKSKLESVKTELDNGADWDTMVTEHSQDPVTAEAKGNMGYFARESLAQMVGEENIPAKIGDISSVIESPSGFHILKVTDMKEKGGLLSLEESEEMLREYMVNKKAMEFLSSYVEELKKAAEIEIKGEE